MPACGHRGLSRTPNLDWGCGDIKLRQLETKIKESANRADHLVGKIVVDPSNKDLWKSAQHELQIIQVFEKSSRNARENLFAS